MQLNTGQYISGVGHIGLIGWALLGGVFTAEPLPFEVTEVTAISSEDFAALVAPQESPDAVSDIVTPQAPDPEEDTPEIAATPDVAPEQVEPEVTEPAEADATPDVAELTPLPEAEVSDEPPVMEPPSEDVAVLIPDDAVRPQPRPAERVAPEPVAQPEPDVRVDDVAQPETTPDEAAEVPREETDETAPEEATTEIVTEAEKAAAAAPSTSKRPQTRPKRTQPSEEPAEEPTETAQSSTDAAVNEALAGLNEEADTTPTPSIGAGGELSQSAKSGFLRQISQCWSVGSASTSVMQTKVTVGFSMAQDGKVNANSIRMIRYEGGSQSDADIAYRIAKSALIRCQNNGGRSGYDLPADKYDQWRNVELAFNPEKMRLR